MYEAVAQLSNGPEPDVSYDLRRWQRDTDGVVRARERLVQVWRHTELEALQQLPSWKGVEQALQDDDRLRAHMNQLVGTVHSASQFDAETVGQCVLPLPDEVGDLEATFARRYERLDRFLAALEIEHAVVWPLPGLRSSEFPITLEDGVELGIMSDEELMAVLNTGALQPFFLNLQFLFPVQDPTACLRYHYRTPKVIGSAGIQADAGRQAQAWEERLNDVRDTLEQMLALLFANPVAIAG